MQPLLSGIVGSVAYGLDHAGSDKDWLGVYAVPTTELFGLDLKAVDQKATVRVRDPDITLHEARKMALLLLAANPTASELLWLPEELYELRTALGDELIGLRTEVLSAPKVRGAYLQYATRQMPRLERAIDRAGTEVERDGVAKDARHLARILYQGIELYETGVLRVRLDDPGWFREFGDRVAKGHVFDALDLAASAERRMDRARSPLPEQPNRAAVDAWLRRVRLSFLAAA